MGTGPGQVRFKTFRIGRRGGKSHYVGRDTQDGLVTDLFKRDQHVWLVAPTYDLAERVWDDFVPLVDKHFSPIIKSIKRTKGDYRIDTKLGTIIEAKSADDPAKLVGVGLNKLIVDEAALIKDKAWKKALRPTLADKRGVAMFISTPGPKNWFYDVDMRGIKGNAKYDPRYASFQFSTHRNEFVHPDEIKEMSKDMPEDEYREQILAEYIDDGGLVFRNIDRIRGGEPEAPRENHDYIVGVDLAKHRDFNVIIVIDRNTHNVVYFRRSKGMDWRDQKLDIYETVRFYNNAQLVIDATGVGDPIYEDLVHTGLSVIPFKFSIQSKKKLINKLQLFVQQANVRVPEDFERILYELDRFSYTRTEGGTWTFAAPEGDFDDCVDALALACWPLIQPYVPIIFDPTDPNGGYPFTSETY